MKLLRIHQYIKNILVFVPLFASHNFSASSLLAAALAFVAFCVCASSVYITNDLADLEADRLNPRKQHCPLPVGSISRGHAICAASVLLLLGLALGTTISWNFTGILVFYFALAAVYSFWLKRKVMIDVIILAIFYSIRVIAGASAVQVVPSVWLLAFSLLSFTALALVKRYSELAMRLDGNLPHSMNRGYEPGDLELVGVMAAAAGFNSVTLFTLYLSSDEVHMLYSRPWLLWLICPLLIYGFGRMLIMAHRRILVGDPIVFILRDKTSMQVAFLVVLVVLAAI